MRKKLAVLAMLASGIAAAAPPPPPPADLTATVAPVPWIDTPLWGVDLLWSPVEGADGYAVYRTARGKGKQTVVWIVPAGSTTAFFEETVQAGKTYVYEVTAIFGDSESRPARATVSIPAD